MMPRLGPCSQSLSRRDCVKPASGNQRLSPVLSNLADPFPSPKKGTAARANRSGGKDHLNEEQRHDSQKPARPATVNRSPIWSEGHLQGWISLGEAAALALSHVG